MSIGKYWTNRFCRFSLRTLAILITLTCAYFAAWPSTIKHAAGIGIPGWKGESTGKQRHYTSSSSGLQYSVAISASAPLPLLLRQDDIDYDEITMRFETTRRYHLWLFGPKFKIPIETTWKHPRAR